MSKIIGLVGMLAPLAALAVLIVHRRRAPLPAAIGMAGAALASLGTVAEFLSERAAWLGSDGMEGVLERLEGWGLLRFGLVAGGLVLLLVAVCVGPGRAVPRFPLALGGATAAALGIAMRLMPLDLGDLEGATRFFAVMALDTLQFGLLGAGILLVAIAVVSGRDAGPEPLHGVIRIARRAYDELRRPRAEQPPGRRDDARR
ncbi:hypothetical protein ACTJJ4_13510 [Microbacterium sp. 22195]|uniref:hypothetical protein n=1 Tax=Microbacterium sp. 22195 TaxID=3453891 RepID=UPI003F826A59